MASRHNVAARAAARYRLIGAVLMTAVVIGGCGPQPVTTSAPAPTATPAATATPALSPTPTPTRSVVGLTREDAVAIARAYVPRGSSWDVLRAEAGRFADLGIPHAAARVSPRPDPDHRVWLVNLGVVRGPLEANGRIVILDFFTGQVIQLVEWIA